MSAEQIVHSLCALGRERAVVEVGLVDGIDVVDHAVHRGHLCVIGSGRNEPLMNLAVVEEVTLVGKAIAHRPAHLSLIHI